MSWLANLVDVSRFSSLADGAGALKDPRGLFFVLAFVVLVLYGLSVGKTKALVSLLAVYVAYTLTVSFPFFDILYSRLPETVSPGIAAGLFLGLYLGMFAIISHAMGKGRLTLGELSLGKVSLISVVQLGLLVSITASLVPQDFAERGLGILAPVLGGRYALWVWATASLAILPFMRTKPNR